MGISSDVSRWRAAALAAARSGLVRPVGPRAALGMAAGLWRSGLTPATLVAVTAARSPDRVLVHDDLGPVTYAAAVERVERVAGALAGRRTPVRQVAVLCRNHRFFLEAVLVGSRLGAEVVLVNTELTTDQLARVLARHAPDVLVHDDEYLDAVASLPDEVLRVRAWTEADDATGLSLDDLAREGGSAPAQHAAAKITLLTSGTTGLAKGVSRDVAPVAVVQSAATGLGALRLRDGDVALVPPPFFHALGFAVLLGTLGVGGTVVTHRRFDADQTLRDVEDHGASLVAAVPLMVQRLLTVQKATPVRTDSLRVVLTGASAISPTTVSEFLDVFGPVLVNLYGATETGIVAIASPQDLAEAPDTVGPPAIGVSVRILRQDRSRAATGERGTIFVRGGMVFDGYTPDGDRTPEGKEVVDGHVNSGDLGHVDEKGRLYVDGRDDDMVVTGGENVFPQEVERVLEEHEAVAESVVVGVRDEEFGQTLVAFVRCEDGAEVDTEELRAHVRSSLERYKTPKRVHLVDDFPRNGTGKILRKRLVEQAEQRASDD